MVVASVVAVASLWYSSVQAQDDRALLREGQITDRYTAAVGNLDADKVEVRLGGIYALERIMQDSPRDHPTIANVLATYLRAHAAKPPAKGQQVRADALAVFTVLGTRDTTHDGDFRLDLRRVQLPRAEFIHAIPDDGKLIRADLSGANLSHADLSDADLLRTNLSEADLSHADLSGTYLSGAHLPYASLFRADLSGANLSHADLSGAVSSQADLSGADLPYADLSGAVFSHADLSGADLSGANLSLADLSGADLSHADLSGADLSDAKLTRKQVDSARVDGETRLPASLS
ncbi:pentapeptide repeat-containing protein [Streptomyces niveus]|uniref:pentapeptide repeat-containing protein n=1 Tax=Streptomyces niveus TaxID=193462 RepID=UPI003439E144